LKEISLGKEHPVLINLWASWCSPCLHELAEWKALQEELKAADVHVVAISVDEIDGKGRLTAIYHGTTCAEQVIADTKLFD
jgi:thiol-disulfide isomerase/thioredoxin